MIDLKDKQALEHHFAENFSTVLFPVLADIYFKEKDYSRARKVCQLGIKHNPDSIDGKYILAKLELLENNIQQAEQHLKFVTNNHQAHINAMRLLFEIQTSLKRSTKTIMQTVYKILRIYPDDDVCKKWIAKNESRLLPEPQKQKKKPTPKTKKVVDKDQKQSTDDKSKKVKQPKPTISKPLNKRFATLTLAKIFKSQGNYQQAIEIIASIKVTDENKKQLDKERKELEKLLSTQLKYRNVKKTTITETKKYNC